MTLRNVAIFFGALATTAAGQQLRASVEGQMVQEKVDKAAAQQGEHVFAAALETPVPSVATEVEAANETEEQTEVEVLASVAVTSSSAGYCSAHDQAIMASMGGGHGRGSLPQRVAECGKHAYSWFSFHKKDMQSCVQKIGLSSGCARCFADAGEWAVGNCKLPCLFGTWCSQSCLSCSNGRNSQTQACAGVVVPDPTTC